MEVITTPPSSSAFTPLPTHESRTPESFFSGKPVLHFHDDDARVLISRRHLVHIPISTKPSTLTDRDHDQKDSQEAINGHAPPPQNEQSTSTEDDDDEGDEEDEEVDLPGMTIWVTSQYAPLSITSQSIVYICIVLPSTDMFETRNVILFNPVAQSGVSIPYPSIILHAIQRLQVPVPVPDNNQRFASEERQGIYMQISIGGSMDELEEDDYEDNDEIIDLKIIPSSNNSDSIPPLAETSTTQTGASNESPIQKLFTAISTCSNLHPDPAHNGMMESVDDDDPDGVQDEDEDDPIVFEGSVGYESGLMPRSSRTTGMDLPPPMPGSSGWITAENVNEFFDEEGNWRGSAAGDEQPVLGSLGPGAGVVRTREDDNDNDEGVAGHLDDGNAGGGEAGGDDVEVEETSQTKWRRTG